MISKTKILKATTAEAYAMGRTLFEEYATALGVDLCFPNFSEELSNLPKMYGPPEGCLLLAHADKKTVGCVAVRAQSGATCEMKRLYVQPEYRGTGLGRQLAEAAMLTARQLGYVRMVLDTLPSMVEAQPLYASLGFCEVEGYYSNPVQGVRYLECELTKQ